MSDYKGPAIPTFNFSGPPEAEIGSSIMFKIDMYIPYPSVSLAVDAFAPLNDTDIWSVCSVMVVDTALNYECLNKDVLNPVFYPSDSGLTNARGRLDLGTQVNKGKRK